MTDPVVVSNPKSGRVLQSQPLVWGNKNETSAGKAKLTR